MNGFWLGYLLGIITLPALLGLAVYATKRTPGRRR
jgi:hypothetical protein